MATHRLAGKIFGTSFARYINALSTSVRDPSGKSEERVALHLFTAGMNVKPCPTCHCPIQKDGGCHHMNCAHCGAHFCWDCLQHMQKCSQTNCLGRWNNA